MSSLRKHWSKALGSTLIVNGGPVGAIMGSAVFGPTPIEIATIICAATTTTSFGAALSTAIKCDQEAEANRIEEPGL